MKLILTRDETGTGFPSANQIEVGELVINSKTGKLYSKLVDGSVIEWIGQKVCYEPLPVIKFLYNNTEVSNIDKFCCTGDNLVVVVDKLKIDPAIYNFDFVELTQNTDQNSITISDAQYSLYQVTIDNTIKDIRKATIPINFSISGDAHQNISIFKFIVYDHDGTTLTEQIITLKCLEANL